MSAATRSGSNKSRWVEAWPDVLAFVGGLSVAWFAQWNATDLVWSLWLSSLVVGYTMIVWMLATSMREFSTNTSTGHEPAGANRSLLSTGLLRIGFLFGLAFFTVHFGGFHFGHSVFLASFFPIEEGVRSWPGVTTYVEVVRRYWIFLPIAFIAERAGFAKEPAEEEEGVLVIATNNRAGRRLFAPYKNVVRMHLLIFFFAGAAIAKLDSFVVYAVVYAVYFFPWRLLRKAKAQT